MSPSRVSGQVMHVTKYQVRPGHGRKFCIREILHSSIFVKSTYRAVRFSASAAGTLVRLGTRISAGETFSGGSISPVAFQTGVSMESQYSGSSGCLVSRGVYLPAEILLRYVRPIDARESMHVCMTDMHTRAHMYVRACERSWTPATTATIAGHASSADVSHLLVRQSRRIRRILRGFMAGGARGRGQSSQRDRAQDEGGRVGRIVCNACATIEGT